MKLIRILSLLTFLVSLNLLGVKSTRQQPSRQAKTIALEKIHKSNTSLSRTRVLNSQANSLHQIVQGVTQSFQQTATSTAMSSTTTQFNALPIRTILRSRTAWLHANSRHPQGTTTIRKEQASA